MDGARPCEALAFARFGLEGHPALGLAYEEALRQKRCALPGVFETEASSIQRGFISLNFDGDKPAFRVSTSENAIHRNLIAAE